MALVRKNSGIFQRNVAPGIELGDDPSSIAKGLTSKFESLLFKIRITLPESSQRQSRSFFIDGTTPSCA
jgi:hypothetical protein